MDIREIPELLKGLTSGDDEPLTFIIGTADHVVAVVNGVIHDNEGYASGDRPDAVYTDVFELYIKTDDKDKLEAARSAVEKYRDTRRFDRQLT